MISRKQIVILLLLNTIILGCVKYDFHTPQLNNDTLPNSCAGIIDTIQNHWQKHKKYNLYQYDDERYIFQLIVDYKQCFTQLDTNAVRQLLGKPSKSEHSRLFYHIDEKCLNIEESLSCTFIFFESKNGKITDIQHGSQEIINCY